MITVTFYPQLGAGINKNVGVTKLLRLNPGHIISFYELDNQVIMVFTLAGLAYHVVNNPENLAILKSNV